MMPPSDTSAAGLKKPTAGALLQRVRRWVGGTAAGLQPDADLANDAAGQRPPAASAPLHLFLDDGLLHLAAGRIVWSTEDAAPVSMRLHELRLVCVHGHAGITTPALKALIQAEVPVLWRDAGGRFLGQMVDGSLRGTETRRAQYRAQADAACRLAVARTLVQAKIVSQRGLLRRRGADDATLRQLAGFIPRAAAAETIDAVMGWEGAAAAAYFGTWDKLGPESHGFAFPGRRRRPPPDPVNAMLSYAYAVLAGEAVSAALAAGLDPHAGLLHAERAGRPALALDLVEPLRPLVADRAVLRIVNRREVTPDDFEADGNGGVRLSTAARRALLHAIEARLAEAAPMRPGHDYRSALFAEAVDLAQALRHATAYACRLVRA
nr:CRISPR-associated endonuclease Cas1 [uncultured Rhodopila sp.]